MKNTLALLAALLLSPDEYKQSYTHLSKRRMELAGMASALDEGIRKIIAALTKKGMMNNTLIIYSTDNGGPSWDDVATNGSLRGGKSLTFTKAGFASGPLPSGREKFPLAFVSKSRCTSWIGFPRFASLLAHRSLNHSRWMARISGPF